MKTSKFKSIAVSALVLSVIAASGCSAGDTTSVTEDRTRYRLGTRGLSSCRYRSEQCREQAQPYGDYRFYHKQKGRKAETTNPLLHRRRKRLGIALNRSFGATANRG